MNNDFELKSSTVWKLALPYLSTLLCQYFLWKVEQAVKAYSKNSQPLQWNLQNQKPLVHHFKMRDIQKFCTNVYPTEMRLWFNTFFKCSVEWCTQLLKWSSVNGRCMNEYGALAEWYWDRKCKLLGEDLSQKRFVSHKSDIVGWDLWWIKWYQERFSSSIWFFLFSVSVYLCTMFIPLSPTLYQ